MVLLPRAQEIHIHVPRHNSQVVGSKLRAEIMAQAQTQNIRADVSSSNIDPAVARAIENASEWNSMLISARAERGPQWDTGTQLFHVDEYSDLYFDPTELTETIRKASHEDGPEDPRNQNIVQQPQIPQTPQRDHQRDYHMASLPQQMTPGPDPMVQHMRTPMQHPQAGYGGYPTTPMRPVPSTPNQYMGSPAPPGYNPIQSPAPPYYPPTTPMHVHDQGSPMRMGVGGMGGMPMNMNMNPAMNPGMDFGSPHASPMRGMGMPGGMGGGVMHPGLNMQDPMGRVPQGGYPMH